jgi:phosphatidylglycerol---prolipoprotein diacylglyceryl transferase
MSFPYLSDLINYCFGTSWNIPVGMFGVFVAAAVCVGTVVANIEVRRLEVLNLIPSAVSPTKGSFPASHLVSDLTLVSVVFGILGARIFHILDTPNEFLADPLAMIFTRAGLSIYGGLICGGVAGAIYLKKYSLPIRPMLDALAPSIALGYGIGRIGCQVSGDCDWGVASNMLLKPDFIPSWFWAQTYENNIAGVLIASPGVYPTPIYEALTVLFIFGILWLNRKNNYSPGYTFSLYLLLSGFSRILIEKIRINSEYQFLNLSFTQAEFISAISILLGLCGLLFFTNAKKYTKLVVSFAVLGGLAACSQL